MIRREMAEQLGELPESAFVEEEYSEEVVEVRATTETEGVNVEQDFSEDQQ